MAKDDAELRHRITAIASPFSHSPHKTTKCTAISYSKQHKHQIHIGQDDAGTQQEKIQASKIKDPQPCANKQLATSIATAVMNQTTTVFCSHHGFHNEKIGNVMPNLYETFTDAGPPRFADVNCVNG